MANERTIVASLAAAVVVAVIAAIGWWWRSDSRLPAVALSDNANGTGARSDSQDESGQTDLPDPADLPSDFEPILEDELEAARRDDSFEPTGPAILEALDVVELAPPPLRDPIVVRVVDRSGIPVPHAKVGTLDGSAGPWWVSRDRGLTSPEDWRARGGLVFECNEEGVAFVNRPRAGGQLIARAGERRGLARMDATTCEPVRIVLREPVHLAVLVTDPAGSPCEGVPVAIGKAGGPLLEGGLATTGVDGLATLFDVDLRAAGPDGKASFRVGFPLLIAQSYFRTLDLDSVPSDGPLRLTLPATGTVRIVLVDDSGARVVERGTVRVEVLKIANFEAHLEVELDAEGVATIKRVGLGLDLGASVEVSGRQKRDQQFRGPDAPGATIEVPFELGPVGPWIEGRLIASDGSPLAGAAIGGRLLQARKGRSTVQRGLPESRTDGKGRFRFDSSHALTGPMRVQLGVWSLGEKAEIMRVDVDLPASGVVDVGDIELREAPPLCAGRVVDELGQPVAHAWISVRSVDPSDEHGRKLPAIPSSRAITDEQGRFELHGVVHRGSASVTASKDGSVPTTADFIAESDDLTLVLVAGGTVGGSLRRPEELPLDQLRAWLVPIDSGNGKDGEVGAALERRIGRDGRFVWNTILPGRYRFELRSKDAIGEKPLVMFPGVEVRAGEVTLDPRLEQIDLEALGRLVRFEVCGVGGARVASGEVVLLAPRPQAPTRAQSRLSASPRRFPIRGGRAAVPASEPIDVVVKSPGCSVARVTEASGFVRLTLESDVAVELVGIEISDPNGDLVARSVDVEPEPAELRNLGFKVRAPVDRAATSLRLPGPGRYVATVLFVSSAVPTDREPRKGDPKRAVATSFEVKQSDESIQLRFKD